MIRLSIPGSACSCDDWSNSQLLDDRLSDARRAGDAAAVEAWEAVKAGEWVKRGRGHSLMVTCSREAWEVIAWYLDWSDSMSGLDPSERAAARAAVKAAERIRTALRVEGGSA